MGWAVRIWRATVAAGRIGGDFAVALRGFCWPLCGLSVVLRRAGPWLAAAGTRLDTTPETILETVRRGWLPEQIEAVSSKYRLEGNPPELVGVEWIDAKIDRRVKAMATATAYRGEKTAA